MYEFNLTVGVRNELRGVSLITSAIRDDRRTRETSSQHSFMFGSHLP